MIKVLLADDEERVCRLIQALAEWETFDMQLVGVAHNGIEALALAEKTKPDIVMTDIRMPGCSGLELIGQMRRLCTQSEFIIISGYTQFEYAKMAIQYGVSDYLLKPINKQELQEALGRLSQKIRLQRKEEADHSALCRKHQDDQRKARSRYLMDVVSDNCKAETLEGMNREYYRSFRKGLFRGFAIKLDYSLDGFSEEDIAHVAERVRRIGLSRLQGISYDADIWFDGSVGYGLVNYAPDSRIRVQERLGQLLLDLQLKREVFSGIVFTLAAADEVEKETEIRQSVCMARQLVEERLIFGSQKVITNHLSAVRRPIQPDVEKGYRLLCQAVELGAPAGIEGVMEQMRQFFSSAGDLTGEDILKIVVQVGVRLAQRRSDPDGLEAVVKDFRSKCAVCGSVDALLKCLKALAQQELAWQNSLEDMEKKRPVQMAKIYLDNHYAEAVSLEQVAADAGFNASYFSVLFKKECGIGFQDYLTELRMKKAKEMLKKSSLPVAEICEQVGYRDLRHFSKTFKKMTGLNPGGYRKLYGG